MTNNMEETASDSIPANGEASTLFADEAPTHTAGLVPIVASQNSIFCLQACAFSLRYACNPVDTSRTASRLIYTLIYNTLRRACSADG